MHLLCEEFRKKIISVNGNKIKRKKKVGVKNCWNNWKYDIQEQL